MLPMVTPKRFPSLFIQGFSLLNKSEFLAKYIICMYFLLISVIYFAKLNALVSSFSDIDGQKFMPNMVNLYLFSSGNLRNHSITSLVSFHLLILRESLSLWFILSKTFLLIQHISFFVGLISLTWSFLEIWFVVF